ncbi:hypothetical protein [Halomonas halodenitrificans]|uniref:hypothetical protein n=1 Tax=Halomonas halodenitrificans TaxID=28252 RepID=UPI0012EB92F7|nr:hypothetical protein [Halomonas halodenitrificans]
MEMIFNIVWTLAVAGLTLLAELIATKFVLMKSTLSAISKDVDSDKSNDEVIAKVRGHLYDLDESTSPLWGAELSAVALSVDFAALGIWIANKSMFPFFSKWNTEVSEYEIPIWLLLFLVHFVALLGSIIFKQFHNDSVRIQEPKKRWMYAGNLVGFMALFSTFSILTDTL